MGRSVTPFKTLLVMQNAPVSTQWPAMMVRSQDFAVGVQENMLARMPPMLYPTVMASVTHH